MTAPTTAPGRDNLTARLQTALSQGRATEVALAGLRTFPAWVVQVAGGLSAGGAVALAVLQSVLPAGPSRGALIAAGIGALLAAAGVVRPTSGAGVWAVGVAGLALLLGGPLPVWALCLLVLLAHLTVLCQTLAACVRAGDRIEIAVLRQQVLRAVPLQVAAQVLALGVSVLAAWRGGAQHPTDLWRIVAVVAAVLVGVAASWLVRRAQKN